MIEAVRQNMEDIRSFRKHIEKSIVTFEDMGAAVPFPLPKSFKKVVDSYYLDMYRELLIEVVDYERSYEDFLDDYEDMREDMK